jgi:hypothetical protein
MNTRILACALLLASTAAFAAGVDGKWMGSIDSPSGPVQITYVFKAEGMKLTGTSTGPDGNTLTLKNGKIDGDKISFSLDLDFGNGPTTFNYTGVVEAKQIKLHSEFMGQPIDFTLNKTT